MSNIRSLVVLDTLKVHQLQVEPKRVKATYTVLRKDGTSQSSELIYSYDNRYFDPKAPEDVNLASMMVAQVALNYGLFFEKIEFDGLFDDTDQRFLRDMMENTSREILVNKFFSKNEFLKPPFDQLRPEKMEHYTASEIRFVNTGHRGMKVEKKEYSTDKDQYAILSSGGKDSLLTYGIVKELGEAHPVYINESGRHWYTAVNAHKYFKEIEPNTVKPWCNSDRIFNWMVRQMPFIKENFQNIRADIYPIRLWTVAVFLFGVLPVVRKRNIGNILIGNEYDTTVKGNHEGITHYHGLYDQSKYFDNALTRYYRKKQWDIHQFSILRSLSELLILKILVKRYPELQRRQVSCHAAHEHLGVMLPCGNCEKCRRIVGMLKALDEDPGRCGYTEEQIERGLQALASRSVKQIGSDAAHLYHLLLEKELIPKNEHTSKLAKEHQEIVKLRFDNERSNLRDLPKYVRRPLFDILGKYSGGSVQLRERKWHTFALENEPFEVPYFLNKEHDTH
ncbi:hypothetical protein [Zeaxanthinibacter enoshimensis]|uniref:7-cyano-7-deazaguanine synthase in queuosine biosynthesis n=1 Tax=Zeaxanthinibacter enoshimensis TaxID=392009 RepID=A0A4R6TLF9_9FLAO|nr:hypothetical protein [Zeaxanthinibacter enoshimensis]TDQ32292.1 hypothetical protein CLV82_0115 [Zeaxanthinibacter enoshimensis]